MYIFERLWAGLIFVIHIITLSPWQDAVDRQSIFQIPLQVAPDLPDDTGPIFSPPGGSERFECDYPEMVGWESCSTPNDRKCWLRHTTDGRQFDVFTNYEDEMPIGVTRHYKLELEAGSYDADGMNFPFAKLFNKTYPGPWIQACWGDTVIVNVTNKLRHNGTSVHWHGIRQNQTMHMDGVNGVTQCPIAPDDYFVYNFTATQYGSSWYHSHYSVQYADGAVGPLTIHGPSSTEWDEPINPPLIMTDWGHNSAFAAVSTKGQKLEHEDILLNGRGNVTNFNNATPNTTVIEPPYNITFEGPQAGYRNRRYLLRIINTSFDTTFVFSIDNHKLTIVSTDFVPITPYKNESVLVGIGQRYNVIVEANPLVYNDTSPLPTDGNYWIRTWVSPCGPGQPSGSPGYERTGIVRYNSSSKALPSSTPWLNVSKDCSDETYESLHPILQWNVKQHPSNGPNGDNFSLWLDSVPPEDRPYPLALWTLGSDVEFSPIRVNYSDPTFFHLDNKGSWNPTWRIIPENYTSTDWVYLVIKSKSGNFGAHPIHLHGHDFALLEQAYNKTYNPKTLSLKFDNPPRRDVVLMPKGGYVVIAFKADNPGAWLVHCHIAFHISQGLGLQIMENQDEADLIWPKKTSKALKEAHRVCKNWDDWYSNPSNWAVPPGPKCKETNPEFCFLDDSGV